MAEEDTSNKKRKASFAFTEEPRLRNTSVYESIMKNTAIVKTFYDMRDNLISSYLNEDIEVDETPDIPLPEFANVKPKTLKVREYVAILAGGMEYSASSVEDQWKKTNIPVLEVCRSIAHFLVRFKAFIEPFDVPEFQIMIYDLLDTLGFNCLSDNLDYLNRSNELWAKENEGDLYSRQAGPAIKFMKNLLDRFNGLELMYQKE